MVFSSSFRGRRFSAISFGCFGSVVFGSVVGGFKRCFVGRAEKDNTTVGTWGAVGFKQIRDCSNKRRVGGVSVVFLIFSAVLLPVSSFFH